jgi:hypothetical protein
MALDSAIPREQSLARLAAVGALLATASDLCLLSVVNSRRPDLLLPAASPIVLWLGGAVGVLTIPLYALGYEAAARAFAPSEIRAARVVRYSGWLMALLGAVIHALTTMRVAADIAAGVPGRDPIAAVAAWGPLLPILWAIASVPATAASVAFAWAVGRGRSRFPPALAWANPSLLTLLLGLAGLPIPILRAFLTPAAPNLAHALFFAACAVALGAPSPQPTTRGPDGRS